MIKKGYDQLPGPIIQFIKNSSGGRPVLPHIYHVSDLVYCLRKSFYRRTMDLDNEIDTGGLVNIFRGRVFDGLYSPLFEHNQRTFLVNRGGVVITGTFDFIHEGVLYDLKMTSSNYYKSKNGAGQAYIRQVKAYLALMHANNEFLEVKKARVLMISESVVVEEVDEEPKFLDWLWERVFLLDEAINNHSPDNLSWAEEGWECSEKYCNCYEVCGGGKKKDDGFKKMNSENMPVFEGEDAA